MLSPSVCRLTLALLVFCWGRSSPIFPCTSLEIGSKSAASVERSSKSPSSLFLALLENGHSPDIFSSFSFAQNIFVAVNVLALCSLSDLRGTRSWWSSCGRWEKFHHQDSVLPATRRFKWSAPTATDRIQYSLKTARAQDGRELSLPKANEKLEEKKNRTAGQSIRKWGWCSWTTYQQEEIISRRLLACDALFLLNLDQPLDWVPSNETGLHIKEQSYFHVGPRVCVSVALSSVFVVVMILIWYDFILLFS